MNKVAIGCEGRTLDDGGAEELGHSAYFLIVDPDTMTLDAVLDNTACRNLESAAGVCAARAVEAEGADSVFAGWLGPGPMRQFEAAQIEIFSGLVGSAKDVLAG